MINLPTKSHTKNIFTTVSILLITAAITTIVGIYVQHIANATDTSGWNAGRIIDDAVFTDFNSMSVAQIQSFLVSQVPNCDTQGTQVSEYGGGTRAQWAASRPTPFYPPFTCLKDYVQDGKTAAQIIYDTAQKYQINPKVFIVLLQKEQSLITDTWPAPYQYRSATGYGCPDTAPCDTRYYGLSNQLDQSGNMFREIMNGVPQSEWYTPYLVGDNYIQYNPVASCGGSNVYIQNRATQALYNYTPYQPNDGALASGWGSAACGAYGNRNFYLYFTKWFGSTTSAATYGYSVVSKEFYSDNTYTTAIPEPLTMSPGQKVYTKITVKNTGNQAWYDDNLRLGTLDPRDHGSVFASSDWLTPGRPATIDKSSVGANETATFKFTLEAPLDLGSYQESFGVLIEGRQWLDGMFTIPITVASASPYYSIKTLSFDTYADAAMTNRLLNSSNITKYTNSTIYAKAVIKNTGNQTLPAGLTRLAASNPIDRSSVFGNNSWLDGYSRIAVAQEGDILPQGTGTFTFSMTIPSNPLARTQEQFGLLIESNRWLSYNIGSISIQTIQRPLSFLGAAITLNANESILSNNEKYRLILQGDGNLVLYNEQWKALWASWTVGKGGIYLIMQADGNLVLYDKNWVAVWNTRTSGKNISSLNMQDDGNIVIYNAKGYTWASWTVQNS